jgi:hypothetical protein
MGFVQWELIKTLLSRITLRNLEYFLIQSDFLCFGIKNAISQIKVQIKEASNERQIKTILPYSGNHSHPHPAYDDAAQFHPEDWEWLSTRKG